MSRSRLVTAGYFVTHYPILLKAGCVQEQKHIINTIEYQAEPNVSISFRNIRYEFTRRKRIVKLHYASF